MSVVIHVYNLTKKLYELAQQPPISEERDSYINKVEELLEQRQQILMKIHPPFSAMEQKLGQEIVQMNAVIDAQLKKEREEISTHIRKIKQKQKQADKYTNPYGNLSFDGTFYDKRK